ncbi:hypothetical protein GCM10010112_91270 [Actinoplanes lobatus]|uniref:Uncharacterized protein n=1 Tax=Actinoplanes lobatus TaxID=113568 RepID=A0A7W7HKH5_9ACTN|nr:hypothetical protein [Actinoplanes lobatus]MBB4752232.1 hypothetical protein [Actinoplanes lobatus]GGN98344.1 hypothetical protein GCM10010112_91270 [Actinoplanes lobatus]GIE45424.1 hypothetical protein Alo02nite_83220 [Actinoplanes lobatus]
MSRDPENEDVEIVVWRDGNGVWRCNVNIDHGHRQKLLETGALELAASDDVTLQVVALNPLPRDTIHIEHLRVSLPVERVI